MRKSVVAMLVLGLAACGGGDDDSEPAEPAEPAADGDGDASGEATGDDDASAAGAGGGAIANPQPPGQALVAVDGQEFTLVDAGAVACAVSPDAITFGYRLGDNEVTLGGGANRDGDTWFGSIRVVVANVPGSDGSAAYFPDLVEYGDRLTVDGASAEYAGPMQLQPPNDGTNPPPVDIGDGVISVTCA